MLKKIFTLRFSRHRLSAAVMILLLLTGGQTWADADHEEVRRLLDAGEILPLETILEKTSELYPDSRVIETEFEEERGGYVYEVEFVDVNGVVWEVEFDAGSGAVISQEEDD